MWNAFFLFAILSLSVDAQYFTGKLFQSCRDNTDIYIRTINLQTDQMSVLTIPHPLGTTSTPQPTFHIDTTNKKLVIGLQSSTLSWTTVLTYDYSLGSLSLVNNCTYTSPLFELNCVASYNGIPYSVNNGGVYAILPNCTLIRQASVSGSPPRSASSRAFCAVGANTMVWLGFSTAIPGFHTYNFQTRSTSQNIVPSDYYDPNTYSMQYSNALNRFIHTNGPLPVVYSLGFGPFSYTLLHNTTTVNAPNWGLDDTNMLIYAFNSSAGVAYDLNTGSLLSTKNFNYEIPQCGTRTASFLDPGTSNPVTSGAITSAPSITSAPMTTSPITSSPLTTSPITSAQITSSQITSSPLTTSLITSSPITSASITSSPLTSASITSAAMTSSPLTTSVITSAPLTSAAVTSVGLTTSPITSAAITSAGGSSTTSPLTTSAPSEVTSGESSSDVSTTGVAQTTGEEVTTTTGQSSDESSANAILANLVALALVLGLML